MQKPINRHAVGNQGEDRAAAYLEGMGMVCLARNLRRSGGEVDLVMRDGACTVFVEVKLRANDRFGLGREAVTIRKQRRMGLVAAQYLAEKGLTQAPARFDVVEIQAGQLRHIPNAFSL